MGRFGQVGVFEVAAFWMAVVVSMVNFALPLLAIRFGASPFQLGLVGTVGSLCYTLAAPFAGRLADRFRPKRLMLIGAAIYAGVYTMAVWTGSVGYLLLLVGLGGGVMSLFWPPLATWIAEGKGREALAKALGGYNMAWCAGMVVGPLLGGVAFQTDFRLPFWGAAAIDLATLAILVRVPEGRRSSAPDVGPPSERCGGRSLLYAVWVANFAGYFTMGTVRSLFPKLGTEIGFSPRTLGILMAVISLTQLTTFAYYRARGGKGIKMRNLLLAQLSGTVGMASVMTSERFEGFALGFLLLGLLLGTTYSFGIFYSLYGQVQMGAYSGLNEAIVGSGLLSGPFLGGWVAQGWGLRAPYLLCTSVIAGALVAECALMRRAQRS